MRTLDNSESADFTKRVHAFAAIHEGTRSLLFGANLHTATTTIQIDGRELPTTVCNATTKENAWVCSPCAAYGDYAAEEARRFGHPMLTWPLMSICRTLAYYLKRNDLDRAVTINNWLLSTNLYPKRIDLNVKRLRDMTVSKWPEHAIWLRSLNWEHNADWLEQLVRAGFQLIPSRQVYLISNCAAISVRSNVQYDRDLLKRTGYRRIADSEFREPDYQRIADLYSCLYTQKYSQLNPQYTAAFIRAWHRAGLLDLHGFQDNNGQLQAAVGIFGVESTLTAPIVGYNTALPPRDGLYRLLMACVCETAAIEAKQINFSAGAAHFKKLRGAVPILEYSAVYGGHLPRARRRALNVLNVLAHRIGVPIMRRFEL